MCKNVYNKYVIWCFLSLAVVVILDCFVLRSKLFIPKVIKSFTIDEGAYSSFENGKCYYRDNVQKARDYYKDESVRFQLEIIIMKDQLYPDESIRYAEMVRLSKKFPIYQVQYWESTGPNQVSYKSTFVGLFSEEELQSIRAPKEFSYLFEFVCNGDGSEVNFEDGTRLEVKGISVSSQQ